MTYDSHALSLPVPQHDLHCFLHQVNSFPMCITYFHLCHLSSPSTVTCQERGTGTGRATLLSSMAANEGRPIPGEGSDHEGQKPRVSQAPIKGQLRETCSRLDREIVGNILLLLFTFSHSSNFLSQTRVCFILEHKKKWYCSKAMVE